MICFIFRVKPYAIFKREACTPLIDTDVHEGFATIKDLVPYLPEPYKSWITGGAWRGLSQPFAYTSPGNGNRADVKSKDGSALVSDYGLTCGQILDRHDMTKAVLTGYFYPTMLKLQYGLANALASAYNDYVVENWLAKDERSRVPFSENRSRTASAWPRN